MPSYVFYVAAWVLLVGAVAHQDPGCVFRAAVYESAFRMPDPDPFQTMTNNLDVFEVQAQLAAKQNANIIVFPEMGITGLAWDSSLDEYYQKVPALGTVPYLDEDDSNETLVVRRLSRMARDSSIYVVANLASASSCGNGSCPARGVYHYNTDAAFDGAGTLVAVYHKQNLYGEPEFDAPPAPEHVFFEAPFGRVGLLTCFDLLWLEPTVVLARDFRVDTVAFPTAWMDQLPYLASVQAQAAWAAGLGVNLLAANMHLPIRGFMGSGLYAGLLGPVNYVYDADADGALIVDDLPCSPSSGTVRAARSAVSDGVLDYHYIKYQVMEPFVGTAMPAEARSARLCQDSLCCGADYSMTEDPSPAGHYALVVHRGNVSEGDLYTFGAEICSVLWCAGAGLESCARQPSNVTAAFASLALWGNFSTPYVYPSVLTAELRLGTPDSWRYSTASEACDQLALNGTCASLLVESGELRATAVSLYGRLYELDVL